MPAKVFISCGQATQDEKDMATGLAAWFDKEGYKAFVAIEVQNIYELNSQIIDELKSSDYYLLINLARPSKSQLMRLTNIISILRRWLKFRGSVYTNQELAVAYAFGFDKAILLNQKNVRKEGILGYIVVNTKEFTSIGDVPGIVKEAVDKSGWSKTFSRHLTVKKVDLHNDFANYGDHATVFGHRRDRIAHIELLNGRPDIAAINCAMRFVSIQQPGLTKQDNCDQGRLKAMGRMGYNQAIWPESSGSFDLFGIHADHYPDTYLHSEMDIFPRQPIIQAVGTYTLTYEIYATGFPKLTVEVDLDLPPTNIMDAKITAYRVSNTL